MYAAQYSNTQTPSIQMTCPILHVHTAQAATNAKLDHHVTQSRMSQMLGILILRYTILRCKYFKGACPEIFGK